MLARSIIALAIAASCAQAQQFHMHPPIAGTGTYTRSVDCSGNGLHAVGYSDDSGNMRTFDWTMQGNVVTISYGGFPGGGWITKFVTSVNYNATWQCGYGDRIVFIPPNNNQVGPRGYREQVGEASNAQIPMFPYANFSDARGISDDGNVVVGRQFNSPFEYAYRYTASSFTLQDLGALPNQFGSAALAVSGDGNTVVGRSGNQAFSWRPNEGMLPLGSLPGQTSAVATCTDSNGLTIAGISNNGVDRGFRWSPIVGMQQLPMLAGGTQLRPHAMNTSGTIIGGQSLDSNGNPTAFIWTSTLGTQTAIAHLVNRGLFGQLGNAVLTDVTGISNDGRFMCGLATSNGVQMGWVAKDMLCATLTGTPGTVNSCAGSNPTLLAYGPNGGTTSGTTSYQWYHNNQLVVAGTQLGGSFISNASSFSLTISGITASDTGNYFCMVSSSGACPIQGPTTTLQIQGTLQMTEHPQSTGFCLGFTASLSAAAGGTNVGTLTYQWYKNNVIINNGPTGNGSTYSGTNTPTLQIIGCAAGDAGGYHCVISNACNSVQSLQAQLFQWGLPSLFQLPAPQVACQGGSASFQVLANNATTYTWEWFNGFTWQIISNGNTFDLNTFVSFTAGGANTGTLTLSAIDFQSLLQIPIRITVANPCRTIRPVDLMLYKDGPMDINGVNDQYFCHHTPALFNTQVFSGFPQQYNWQILDPTFNTWLYLNNGFYIDGFTGISANVSGVFTPNLSFNIVAPGTQPNQLFFRCAVANTCGWQFSPPGMLTLCRGDYNCDMSVDFFDYLDFVDDYSANLPHADFNGDGFVDFFDYLDMVDAYSAGC